MKCDELHPASLFEFEKVLKGRSNKLFYAKADVDAAIAELKANNERITIDNRNNELRAIESATAVIENVHLVYRKSEADKVMAELKADYKEACGRLQTANHIKDEQLAATRRQKYKRCLAMARLCNEKWLVHNFAEFPTKLRFYDRWEKRWLELAEKFKEAK